MKNTIQQFIDQGGKDVLKELGRNVVEEIIEDFKGKTFSNNDDVINYLRLSLQKAINAERERCLGCVPKELKLFQVAHCSDSWDLLNYSHQGFNNCREIVINKINN